MVKKSTTELPENGEVRQHVERYFFSPLRLAIDNKLCRYLDWLLNFIDLKTLITCNKWIISIHDETLQGFDNVVIQKEICVKDFLRSSKTTELAQEQFYRKLYIVSKSLYMHAISKLTYTDIHKYSVSVSYIKKGLLDSDRFDDRGAYIMRKPLIKILNSQLKVNQAFDELF